MDLLIRGTNATSIARSAHRVCALHFSRGAAAGEGSKDRLPNDRLPTNGRSSRTFTRSISPRSARVWLRRGEEYPGRVPICGGKVRTVSGSCGRTGPHQGRHHRRKCNGGGGGGEESDPDDPDHHSDSCRSCRVTARGQPCTSWWERYRAEFGRRSRDERQTA